MNKMRAAAILGAATSLVFATGVGPAGAVTATNATSKSMAGIEVSGARAWLVSTRVQIPTIDCSSGDSDTALIAGVARGGIAGRGPLHPPRRTAVAGILLKCTSNVLAVQAVAEINQEPFFTKLAVSPGDTVILEARQNPRGATVRINDVTTGKSTTIAGPSGTSGGTDDAADIGILADPFSPVPAFGTVHFLHSQVNTVPVSGLSPVAYDYTNGTSVQIQTGPFNTAHDRFPVTSLTS